MGIVSWWQLVWLCVAVQSPVFSEDVNESTECYIAAAFLRLSCDAGTVISIVWDATFFGRSSCSGISCCPGPADCTVLVIESDQAGGSHWESLSACNGQTTCAVQVSHSAICATTDYETVTYICVTPDISSTETTTKSIKDTSTEPSTTKQALASKETLTTKQALTTSSTAIRTQRTTQLDPGPSQTGRTVSSPTGEHDLTTGTYKATTIQSSPPLLGDGDTNTASSTAVIAVSVSLSMLLVLSVAVASVVCYRRGLAVGVDRGTNRQLDPGNHAVLSTGRKEGNPHYENTTNPVGKVYEMPGEVFAEPAPTYTALERHYENTGYLAQTGQTG